MTTPQVISEISCNFLLRAVIMDVAIPQFPPFQLRLSLIDKDPVIWVHLLEGYIQLLYYLSQPSAEPLSVKSQQDLHQFLRLYLSETSDEQLKIFSLGAINPDIKNNQKVLRAHVFNFIRLHSIVKCNLPGDLIWNFAINYARDNIHTVRGLIDGTYTSKLNDNKILGHISLIPLLHKFLEAKISRGEFSQVDLHVLSTILGQMIGLQQKISLALSKVVEKPMKKSTSQFAALFVTSTWIEIMERLWNKGNGVNASLAERIMVLSLVLLNSLGLNSLCRELGVSNATSLKLFPLFGTCITLKSFQQLIPNIEDKIPWLRDVVLHHPASDEDVTMIKEIFPDLSEVRAKELLEEYGSVEVVMETLFDSPSLIQDQAKPLLNIERANVAARFGEDQKVELLTKKKSVSKETLKNKTLETALMMLYESDEDEPDDTYEDQEKTTGSAFELPQGRHQRRKIAVDDHADNDNSNLELLNTNVDARDTYLYGMMKKYGDTIFDKRSRKLPERKEIKNATSWTDEQVEGWWRMITRLQRKFRMLEENYLFARPNNSTRLSKQDSQDSRSKSQTGIDSKVSEEGSPNTSQKVNVKVTTPVKVPKHKKKSHHKAKDKT